MYFVSLRTLNNIKVELPKVTYKYLCICDARAMPCMYIYLIPSPRYSRQFRAELISASLASLG